MNEMNDDVEITSKGYSITLTHKPTGNEMTCSLAPKSEKWVVRGNGYQGYFKDLDNAVREAFRHLRYKLKEGDME